LRIKIIGLSLLLLVLSLLVLINNAFAIPGQINRNINAIMHDVDRMATEDPSKAMSSNPYTYIEGNANYRNIVNLGSSALPVLVDMIKNSKENGLREYILAIAVEEIAKVDLKGDNFGWSNAKEFVRAWNKHLKSVPDSVNNITSSEQSNEAKVEALVKLGTPAIPFILDRIEQGRIELAPALGTLLKGNNKVDFNADLVENYTEWARMNRTKFDDLRNIVMTVNN